MARRHPDRTVSHHRYPPAPPIRPRPTSTPASPQAEPRWVSNPGRRAGSVGIARRPRADICRRRWGEPPRTRCEPQMRQPSARPAESHIGGTQTFSSSPGYPYTDSGHFQPCDHGLQPIEPRTRRRGHPTFARLTSAQSAAEQTRPNVVAFVPVADRRAPPIRPDRRRAR